MELEKFSSEPTQEYEVDNTTVYIEPEIDIGNGDPVAVYNSKVGAVCLGTGFTSMRDIAYGIQQHIGVNENECFSVFSIEGQITFGEEK